MRNPLRHVFRNLVLTASVAAILPAATIAQEVERPTPPSASEAPIAYLFDVTSGQILFEREADRRFMPASITKVMTTFLAFEWMEEGKILPQQSFSLRPPPSRISHR